MDAGDWQSHSQQCVGTETFDAQPSHTYTFRLTATDNVGNQAQTEAGAFTTAVTRYYYFGGKRVAMRGPDDAVVWLHGDHLGSTSLATDAAQAVVPRQLYYPFGGTRWSSVASLPTDFQFTGQRNQSKIALYDYHARFYDPYLNRFISADTIVPSPGNPQTLNRYSYVENQPIQLVDPSGHDGKGTVAVKHRAKIESEAERAFDISQLAVHQGWTYSGPRYGSGISPILLGAAMDRQNASRHRWGLIGGIVEYGCSHTKIGPCQGGKTSVGPANIEMKELDHWQEIGWLAAHKDRRRRAHNTEYSIFLMRMKLAEADARISFYGGPNVNTRDRFLLLTLAQNAVAYSTGFIENFFNPDSKIGGWGPLLSKGSVTQMGNMFENIYRLHFEYGWDMPTGVAFEELVAFWLETLGPKMQGYVEKGEVSEDLFNRLNDMYGSPNSN